MNAAMRALKTMFKSAVISGCVLGGSAYIGCRRSESPRTRREAHETASACAMLGVLVGGLAGAGISLMKALRH
jgi:hypothetical protein